MKSFTRVAGLTGLTSLVMFAALPAMAVASTGDSARVFGSAS